MGDLADDRVAYNEREVGAILRRAADLQAREENTAIGAGITLGELERASADIGIDPRFVRAAAAEHEREGLTASAGLIELRREVSVEVTDETWEEMVAELRSTFGHPGTVSRSGRAYEWHLKREPDPETRPSVQVTVRTRDGRSEIVILSSVGTIATVSWLVGGLSGLGASLLTVEPLARDGHVPVLIGLLIAAGIMGSTLLATYGGLTPWLRQDRRKLNRLLNLLATRAEEELEERPTHIPAPVADLEIQPLWFGR